MLVPAALRPGDLIDVVAPSSPFDRTLAWRGLGWLRERYRVRFDAGIFETDGYLAGNDARRQAELDRAFRCPDSRAIVAIRGGYGLNRIAHQLDWNAFLSNPKWIDAPVSVVQRDSNCTPGNFGAEQFRVDFFAFRDPLHGLCDDAIAGRF